MTKPTRVCIVGVGLIGGSLGLALRRVRKNGKRRYTVVGVGRDRTNLLIAKKRGAADTVSTKLAPALRQADVVFLCMPVHRIVPFVRKNISLFKKNAVITDVGSVKQSIVDGVKPAFAKRKDLNFIGGHPIAGSEKTGAKNADATLFRNAAVILTKDNASFRAMDTVKSIWTSVGARCYLAGAAEHDRWLSLTSHVPHLLAFALFSEVNAAAASSPVKSFVAGSFRDMTRIAGADPELWAGIISNNRASIKKSVNAIIKQLRFFADAPPVRLRRSLTGLARAKASWQK